MTRTTRIRLILIMVAAGGYALLGVAVTISHLQLHGVLALDAVDRTAAALLIEWLAYESYVVRARLDRVSTKLDRVNRRWEMIS